MSQFYNEIDKNYFNAFGVKIENQSRTIDEMINKINVAEKEALTLNKNVYFEEKAEQIIPSTFQSYGIEVESRYGKAYEIIEMLKFVQFIKQLNLCSHVNSLFYDSKACICTFKFNDYLNDDIQELFLEAGLQTISQFHFDDMIIHHCYNNFYEEWYEQQMVSVENINFQKPEEVINNILQKALSDLQIYPRWCDVINFEASSNESYKHEAYQAHYTLRYFLAYLFEYCFLFKQIEQNLKIDSFKGKKILSVGCGSCTDYYALRMIANNDEFEYIGIDIIDWNYRPNANNIRFYNTGIEEISEDLLSEIDIIIFPKSIGNMPNKIIDFANKIKKAVKKDFIIGYSFIKKSEEKNVYGIKEATIIHDIIKSDFMLDDNSIDGYKIINTEKQKIEDHYEAFKYPYSIQSNFVDFSKNCPSSKKSALFNKCDCSVIDRLYPMKSLNFVAISYKKYIRKRDLNDN